MGFTHKDLIERAEREGVFLREQSDFERLPESMERGEGPVRWIEVTNRFTATDGWFLLLELAKEADEGAEELYYERSFDDPEWGMCYDDYYFVQLPNHDLPEWIDRNDLYKRIMESR